MAKLSEMSLRELYDRKSITSTVEKVILSKEDFSGNKSNPDWCGKVCKLKCKNPPASRMFATEQVDILIIQDYSAFDDTKFKKRGEVIEQIHLRVLGHLANSAFPHKRRTEDGSIKDVYPTYAITSLLKCNLQSEDIKKGKAPSDTILIKCRPYLLEEIRVRKPKAIISLGKSVNNVLGLTKTSNYRDCGDILSYNGLPVVITLHPKILLMLRQNASGQAWGPDFYSIILGDFRKAVDVAFGRYDIPNLDEAIERVRKDIVVVKDLKQLEESITEIYEVGMSGGVISFDTETIGLDPYSKDAKLLCIQFGYRLGDKIKAIVIPLWHRRNIWINPNDAWSMVTPVLLNKKIKKIGHHVKFDFLYIAKTTGIMVEGIIADTMLLLHALNSGLQGMYGLKRAVVNLLPETGLQGYEDRLPKLTKQTTEESENGAEGDNEESSGESTDDGDSGENRGKSEGT